MEATVLPDRITIGPEFVPRRLDLPLKLIVPAGQTMILADGAVLDYVEVSGTLTVSRFHNTTARITTLIVMPDGLVDFGTAANPLPSTIRVKVSIRNVSIDYSKDPFQWGNGIVNFGDWTVYAAPRTPSVLINDVPAGVSAVTLQAAPSGWQVGDELVFPDLLPHHWPELPNVEATVTIAALTGTTLTLSKPLDFAHVHVHGEDGRVGVQPCVLNITRNVVFTSDDPVGLPGHIVNTGDMSCWDIQGAAFIGLGRTTVAVLDSTSSDLMHIGTNQIGKYAFHEHHVHMPCTFPRQFVGNVLIGGGSGKWGHVTHGTSDTLVKDNIGLRFPGAAFITEDGYEVRNKFIHNVAVNNYRAGAPIGDLNIRENLANNRPGTEGTGFWFHGVQQYIEQNEAYGNFTGISLFAFKGKPGLFPSVPDGMPDTPYATPYTNDGPFHTFVDNLTVGSLNIGLDIWGIKDAAMTGTVENLPIFDRHRSVYDYFGIVTQQAEAFNSGWFRSPIIIQQYQQGNGTPVSVDVLFSAGASFRITTGYETPLKITDPYFSGGASAIYGLPNGPMIVQGGVLQGAVGLNFDGRMSEIQAPDSPIKFLFTNVAFTPYGHHPPRYIIAEFDGRTIWDGTGPFPLGGTIPDPPPPPPPPTWTTVPGTFQTLNTTPAQFRFCTDPANEATCQLFVKP